MIAATRAFASLKPNGAAYGRARPPFCIEETIYLLACASGQ